MRSLHHVGLLALLVALLTAPPAGAAERWLHMTVVDHYPRHTRVELNLPASSVEAALPLIPGRALKDCRLEFSGSDLTRDDVVRLISGLRGMPEGERTSFLVDGGRHQAWREAGYVNLIVRPENLIAEPLRVRLPQDVLEALVTGEGRSLNVVAAAKALLRRGGGELLLVNGDDATVRFWIDDRRTSGRW